MRAAVVAVLWVAAFALVVQAGDGSKTVEERVAVLESRMSAVERRLGLDSAAPTAAPAAGRAFAELEDPRKVAPPASATAWAKSLHAEWLMAYMDAFGKSLEVDALARTPGTPGTSFAGERAREVAIARQDLALLVSSAERARAAYVAELGKK